MPRICSEENVDKKVSAQKEFRYKENFLESLMLDNPRKFICGHCPRKKINENFQSDLEDFHSLQPTLKNWLESTISMSRTTSQDSHLCSNVNGTTATDGASERSSEKSYKIVTQDDFFVGVETAGKIVWTIFADIKYKPWQ